MDLKKNCNTPGPIKVAAGFCLYQLDGPSGTGAGNLWSGDISANNGYDPIYAKKAVQLFKAAPDLLEVAQLGAAMLLHNEVDGRKDPCTCLRCEHIHKARAAIAKATQPKPHPLAKNQMVKEIAAEQGLPIEEESITFSMLSREEKDKAIALLFDRLGFDIVQTNIGYGNPELQLRVQPINP